MNKATIIGNTTKNIELKTSKSGNPWCSFTLATNKKDKATFIPCVAFGKTAELMSKYVKKGNKVCVVGEIELEPTESFSYKFNINVNEVEFLTPKNSVEKDPTEDLPF